MEIVNSGYQFNKKLSRKRPIKRIVLGIVAFLFVTSSGSYTFLALNKDVAAITAERTSFTYNPPATIDIKWPLAGQSAIGSLEDGVLASSTVSETQKPMASITKLITALVLINKQPISPGKQGKTYAFTAADVAIYENYRANLGSVLMVRDGQVLTEYQALQALLLVSANNIADSVVIKEFGSMDNFLAAANQFVASNGWQNTKLADASGFSTGSMSTPSDLVKIGQEALQDAVIAEIVSQREATIAQVGVLKNTNQLLSDANVVGIKTGTTDEAGSCLLFAVKHGPENKHIMIGAVMGQPNWTVAYGAIRALRDSALGFFREIELVAAGTKVGFYKSPWRQESEATTAASLSTYGWIGKQYSVDIVLEQLSVPANAQQIVGKVTLVGKSSTETDVKLSSEINQPNIFWKLANVW